MSTQDATKAVRIHVPKTVATPDTAGDAQKCALACAISEGMLEVTGIEPEDVRVYRTMTHVTVFGVTTRYANSRPLRQAIKQFDGPEQVFVEGVVKLLPPPPSHRSVDGKLKGSAKKGTSAPNPRPSLMHRTTKANLSRVRSVKR
jgi:hypothetical protein